MVENQAGLPLREAPLLDGFEELKWKEMGSSR